MAPPSHAAKEVKVGEEPKRLHGDRLQCGAGSDEPTSEPTPGMAEAKQNNQFLLKSGPKTSDLPLSRGDDRSCGREGIPLGESKRGGGQIKNRVDVDPEANERAAEHIDLVQQIVNQVAMRYPRHVDRSELWSAGAAGLVEASRSYRSETGIPFGRYAAIRIRGAIIDSTRKRDWAVRSLRRRMREMHEAEDRFEVSEGRKPSELELSQLLGLTLDELRSQRSASVTSSLLHLDQEDPDKVSLGDRVEERSADRIPEDTLANREMLGTLRALLPSSLIFSET